MNRHMNDPLPGINLNGTSGEALLAEYTEALNRVNQAISAVNAATCHGRDFQTRPVGAFFIFAKRRRGWIENLTAIARDIELVALDLQRQVNERKGK